MLQTKLRVDIVAACDQDPQKVGQELGFGGEKNGVIIQYPDVEVGGKKIIGLLINRKFLIKKICS